MLAKGMLASALVARPAGAETSHAEHPDEAENVVYLTLEEALRRGAKAGPERAVSEAPLGALNDAVDEANPLLTQSPLLQAQVGPRLIGGRASTDVTVSLTQPMPLSPQGRLRLRLARAEQKAANQEVELSALDGAERAGQAWIDLVLSEHLLALRKDAEQRAQENLRILQVRANVGEIEPSVLAVAQGELASTRSSILEAEGQHYLAASDLTYFTGLSADARAEVKTTQLGEPDAHGAAARSEDMEAHPVVQSATARAQASKEAIAYAKSQQMPTFSLGVQYQREGTGDQIITGLLSVPLPFSKPWSFQEARTRAEYDQQAARAVLAKRELERLLKRARHERSHAYAQYALLKTELVPPKREAVRLARISFEAGEYDYLQVSLRERELLAAEERLAVAKAEVHRAELHLLRCTGQLGEKIQ